MAKVIVTKSKLDSLASSISTKSGVSTPMTIDQMKSAVDSMSSSGITPTGTIQITQNGTVDVTQYASANVSVPSGSPTLQSKSVTYTPSESAQSETVSADSGYDGLSSVSVSVGAVSSSYVGSGIDRNDSTDLTASGATVTAPAGYYASAASKSVASGTAGTPTATKGTVSNHSVTVTPSVTNTAGYIAGGIKTGTAVTVSASELVSGSETKTENGTYDVTNLAELVVNVSGGGAKTKTGTFTGSGSTQVSISCDFEPDLIYVYGNLSGSSNLRGVVSLVIIKDIVIYLTADASTSSTSESLNQVNHNVNGYGGSSSAHASYSSGTLTLDTAVNSNASRWNSSITYNYTLIKWT